MRLGHLVVPLLLLFLEPLVPGVPGFTAPLGRDVGFFLREGQARRVYFPADLASNVYLGARQDGVDVELRQGEELTVDVLGPYGWEELWLEGPRGAVVEVRARKGAGRVCLRVRTLDAMGSTHAGCLAAWRATLKAAASMAGRTDAEIAEQVRALRDVIGMWDAGSHLDLRIGLRFSLANRLNRLGRYADMVPVLEEALALTDRQTRPWLTSTLTAGLATAYFNRAMPRPARDMYVAAEAAAREAGLVELAAHHAVNCAAALSWLGQGDQARKMLKAAEGIAYLYPSYALQLGWADYVAGRPDRAMNPFVDLLALHANAPAEKSVVLQRAAPTLLALDEPEAAFAVLDEALESAAGDHPSVMGIFHRLSPVMNALGAYEEAEGYARLSLDYFAQRCDEDGMLFSLADMAVAAARQDRPERAVRYVGEGMGMLAGMAGRWGRGEERVDVVAARHHLLETSLDLTMAGEEGHIAVRAAHDGLQLFDSLRQSRIARGLGDDGDTTPAPPLTVSAMQALLDDDTQALVYAQGDEVGYLWLVDTNGVVAHVLPDRKTLEQAARLVHEALSGPDSAAPRTHARLQRLSDVLLAPIADRLTATRLMVVADGLLQFVPFSALPYPGRPGTCLLDAFEIVYVPSFGALRDIRRQAPLRRNASGMGLVCDPQFATVRVSDEVGILPRLPGTRREGDLIQEILDGVPVSVRSGSDADPASVLALAGSHKRMLHFATHGFLTSGPQGNGLVVAQVDAAGGLHEGLLRPSQIAELPINAELVVLSACHSGLGEIRPTQASRGMVRAFLDAGAARLFVGLWQVDDAVTTRLMAHFYRFLREGQPPSQAARSARLAVKADPATSAPYHWASFVFVGDWHACVPKLP